MKMEQSEFESMRVAIGRRDTGAIRQLLETGFDLTDTPVTSGGREQPYYYIGQLLQSYLFYNRYDDLMELLPLFLERVEPLNGLDLESFGRINADEYTERIIRLLVSHVGEINEQDRSGYSILHERLKSYRNTYIGLFDRNKVFPPEENEPDIMLDVLLERDDLDVNLMTYDDLPPLYFGCKHTTGRIVRKLLEKGADVRTFCGKGNNSLLHIACDGEKVEIVSLLIDFGVDVNVANTDSETPLHLACKKQNIELIRCLLEKGADVTERDKYGNTPLHILVKETTPQTIECIDLLLEKGADINALNNGMCTPFFVCAQATDRQFRNRNALLLKHLLTRGAYADTQDFRQNNPLYYAVQDDDLERVSLLLKAGVDPNCRNEQNVSPYKLALQKNRRAIISLIEKSQITITATPDDLDAAFMKACIAGQRGVAEMLFKSGNIDITYVDDHGRTPLHYIAKAGMVALAGFVLDKGLDINYMDKDEQTALHIAAAFRQKEMVRLLLSRGADGNIRDNEGLQPIHYVARSGQFDVLGLMWKLGYDLETPTDYGDTPLHIAAYRRAKENVRLLLSIGVQPDPQNNAGVTLLQHAVVGNQKEIVKMLVENGADVHRADVDGDTPIHWAANHGYKDMVQLLLELGADINALNDAHQTALHIAAIRKNKDLFKYLLESGADFEIKTAKGNSCIDLATTTGQKELIELIGIIQRRREALAD